jgi:hypothetical protein
MLTKYDVPMPPMGEAVDVVRSAYDQIEAGALEVLADERSHTVRQTLALPLGEAYPELEQLGLL